MRDYGLPRFAGDRPPVPTGGLYEGRLDDDGELVVLSNGAAISMFSFTYDNEAPWDIEADGLGYSLILIDPEGNPNAPSHWQASIPRGGTPGEPGGLEGEREGEGGCESECECGGGGGGEAGVPVCLVISPTDAGPDDEITVTAYDEEGVKVDLSEWTGGVEMNFAGSGEEGFMIFPGDDEMVDGSVVIVLGEGRFNHNQWDFFTWIQGTDLNAWLPVAMPGFGEGAIFDYVPDAIAAGGTCED